MDTLTTPEGERIDVRYHEAINHLHEAEANRRGLLDTYADTTAEDRNARIAAYHQAIGQHLKAGQVHALLAIADAIVGAVKRPDVRFDISGGDIDVAGLEQVAADLAARQTTDGAR